MGSRNASKQVPLPSINRTGQHDDASIFSRSTLLHCRQVHWAPECILHNFATDQPQHLVVLSWGNLMQSTSMLIGSHEFCCRLFDPKLCQSGSSLFNLNLRSLIFAQFSYLYSIAGRHDSISRLNCAIWLVNDVIFDLCCSEKINTPPCNWAYYWSRVTQVWLDLCTCWWRFRFHDVLWTIHHSLTTVFFSPCHQ